MAQRTLTGIARYADGSLATSETITFDMGSKPGLQDDAILLQTAVTVTTHATTGAFTAVLEVPDDATLSFRYRADMPDGNTYHFLLASGSATTLQAVLASQSDAVTGSSVDALLGSYATTVSVGHVSVKAVPGGTSAVGDGVADDTAALASAVAYAVSSGIRRVFLPAGTYLVTGTLALTSTHNNMEIFGEGAASIIQVGGLGGTLADWNGGTGFNGITIDDAATSIEGIALRNFALHGSKDSIVSKGAGLMSGISVGNSWTNGGPTYTKLRFEGLLVHDWWDSQINIFNKVKATVLNCESYDGRVHGMSVGDVARQKEVVVADLSQIICVGSTFHDNGKLGINVLGDLILEAFEIYNNTLAGIKMSWFARHVTMANGRVYDNSNQGIRSQPPRGAFDSVIHIDNTHITGNQGRALELAGTKGEAWYDDPDWTGDPDTFAVGERVWRIGTVYCGNNNNATFADITVTRATYTNATEVARLYFAADHPFGIGDTFTVSGFVAGDGTGAVNFNETPTRVTVTNYYATDDYWIEYTPNANLATFQSEGVDRDITPGAALVEDPIIVGDVSFDAKDISVDVLEIESAGLSGQPALWQTNSDNLLRGSRIGTVRVSGCNQDTQGILVSKGYLVAGGGIIEDCGTGIEVKTDARAFLFGLQFNDDTVSGSGTTMTCLNSNAGPIWAFGCDFTRSTTVESGTAIEHYGCEGLVNLKQAHDITSSGNAEILYQLSGVTQGKQRFAGATNQWQLTDSTNGKKVSLDFDNNNLGFHGVEVFYELDASAPDTLTGGGVVTLSGTTYARILANSPPGADDVEQINGLVQGQMCFVGWDSGNGAALTFKHGVGNILCQGGADIAISATTHLVQVFCVDGTNVLVVPVYVG